MIARVNIRAALACEDIRTEITGKSIYLGVYGPTLFVPTFPCALNFSFILIVDFLEVGSFELDAQIVDETDKVLVHGKLGGDVQRLESGAPMNFVGLPVAMSGPTVLRLQARYAADGNWETVQSWSIEQMPTVQLQPQETSKS